MKPASDHPQGLIKTGLLLVVVVGILSVVIGLLIQFLTDRSEFTIFQITFDLSPVWLSVYGMVAMSTFLIVGYGVLTAIDRFDSTSE